MKTKKYGILAFIITLLGGFSACDDYLDFQKPSMILVKDAFITSTDALASVTAAYTPLVWEYQNNGGTFFPEWWIGDVCSDDALKGGDALKDMDLVYDMENFKTRSDNNVLLWFYRVQYFGAFRCNFALEHVAQMDSALFAGDEKGLQNRILGEALFLRAFYHFRLVRIFGGVPLANQVIKYQEDWKQSRASKDDVYQLIYNDLKTTIQYLPEKNAYKAVDLGRATKGAARALLMKAYMNNHLYEEAKLQGDSIIASAQYTLVNNYWDLFTLEGENGAESIFETQYISDAGSDAWNGIGATQGTLTPTMTRPRWGSEEGWGFNRPSQELYDEFEFNDPRRETAIYSPTLDQVAASDDNTNNINVYLGNRYTARKYALMNPDTTWIPLGHSTRGGINRKEIRYADVLLLYAEACCKKASPDFTKAKWALEEVRNRSRVTAGKTGILPSFPNYSIPLQSVGKSGERHLQDNAEDLYLAIQHERRVELAMEGHRWFDLVRWGIAAEVMNHYRATTKPRIAEHIAEFVKGKHELFPIPLQERDLNSPMPQNPGYDGVPVNH